MKNLLFIISQCRNLYIPPRALNRLDHVIWMTFLFLCGQQNRPTTFCRLNLVHPNLSFTWEFQSSDGSLPFLDVLVSRHESNKAVTSVFHKPTWSGLYGILTVLCRSAINRLIKDRILFDVCRFFLPPTAALQSVFPQTELGAFMAMTKREKERHLQELTMIVTGIRLFNKDCGKGGEGIDDCERAKFEFQLAVSARNAVFLISSAELSE